MAQYGSARSVNLLISTNDEDGPTGHITSGSRNDDGVMRVEADQKSRRLFPRIEFHEELPEWITSSDEAAYGPCTRTIYLATGRYSKLRIAWSLLHELGHHIIEVVSGNPEWQYAYDDFYDLMCERVGRFFDFVLRRK